MCHCAQNLRILSAQFDGSNDPCRYMFPGAEMPAILKVILLCVARPRCKDNAQDMVWTGRRNSEKVGVGTDHQEDTGRGRPRLAF